jgi:hypothetical protein
MCGFRGVHVPSILFSPRQTTVMKGVAVLPLLTIQEAETGGTAGSRQRMAGYSIQELNAIGKILQSSAGRGG